MKGLFCLKAIGWYTSGGLVCFHGQAKKTPWSVVNEVL
jgi:hypothetical protein